MSTASDGPRIPLAAAEAFIEKTKGFGGMADKTTAAISMAYADALIAVLEVK